MRKKIYALILVVLICLTAGCLSACNDENLKHVSPTNWTSYLDEINDILVNDVKPDSGQVSIELSGLFSVGDSDYECYFGLNYDIDNIENSVLIFEVYQLARTIFSLKSDYDNSYFFIAPNEFVNDAKLKLTGTGLFDWLNMSFNNDNWSDGTASLKNILGNFGRALFNRVEVNADNTEYAFHISNSLWKAQSAKYINALFTQLDENAQAIVFGIFGVETIDDILLTLPKLEGDIVFNVMENKVVSIAARDFSINGTLSKFNCNLRVKDSLIENLSDKMPSNDIGYLVTKVATVSANGNILLYTAQGNVRAVKYNYELNMNFDLFKLILNDYDLTKLSDDNFFHLRISHKCDSSCTEFCRHKLSWELGGSKGAVLDVAFSPRDFNNNNLFIAMDMFSILGMQYFNSINSYSTDLSTSTMPQYAMYTMSSEDFAENTKFRDFLFNLYIKLTFVRNSFELGTEDIIALADGNGLASDMLSQFFKSEDYDSNRVKVTVENKTYWQVNEYDIYKQVVYIIADDVANIKHFYNEVIQSFVKDLSFAALDWTYEANQPYINGETLTNIYDVEGNQIHGISDGRYIPMSPKEAAGLVGSYLKAQYVGIYKDLYTDKTMKIESVEGLDLESTEVQTIKVTVQRPSFLDYLYFKRLFKSYNQVETAQVEIKIKLTRETGYELVQNLEPTDEFRVTYRSTEMPKFMRATAVIHYEGGLTKQIQCEGVSNAVSSVYPIIPGLGSRTFTIKSWGKISVKFSFTNRSDVKYFNVKEPDRFQFDISPDKIKPPVVGENYLTTLLELYAKLYAYYGETRVQVELSMDNYFINDIPLSHNSTNWGVYDNLFSNGARMKFNLANKYQITIKKQDQISAQFDFSVVTKQNNAPEYSYSMRSPVQDYYFVGSNNFWRGKIENSLHGETTDLEKTFNVQVYAGMFDQNGNFTYSRNEITDASILEKRISVGSYLIFDKGYLLPYEYNVPAMITDSLTVDFGINFKVGGYYKVVFTMSGEKWQRVTSEWNIYVGEKTAV